MMKRLILTCTFLLVASVGTGCIFYGGDDDPCYTLDAPQSGLRNPVTGACESVGGGGGCYWGAYADAPEPGALPDWASCPGMCEALDELSCLVTSGCRAAYQEDSCPPWADCVPPGPPSFLGCWGTSQSGPIQGGGCTGLDAWECSRHDDCTATYTRDWNVGDEESGNRFAYCADERWGPGCYSDMECPAGWECSAEVDCLPPPGCGDGQGNDDSEADELACPAVCYGRCQPAQNGCEAAFCPPGSHCELQCTSPSCDFDSPGEAYDDGYACEVTCVPDQPWGCEAILCGPGTTCETVCADACAPGADCPSQCWSACVPDGTDPGRCDGDVWCDGLPPACPTGTVAGIAGGCWSGYCIPVNDCGPSDPGGCEPADCERAAPSCPSGTVAGVRDGCYTGYCIPAWRCESDLSCASLADQASCAARTDCQPVYSGAGCTCYPDGSCSCQEWQYLRCETAGDASVMPF